jgi:hypothetical protein
MIEVDLVKKHGKKALGIEEHAHHAPTWRERVPEILLEIAIIVFAISLSIWLHNWQEHRHDRAQEQRFLLGLKADLRQDLQELRADSASYVQQMRAALYFRSLTRQTLRADSVRKYSWMLYNETGLIPNDSRFQGLKASGKLDVIEDEKLLNSILDHYQEVLPSLVMNTGMYSTYKTAHLGSYLDEHLSPDQHNLVEVMQQIPVQNYLKRAEGISGILQLYHRVSQHSRDLLRQIDKRLTE